MKLGKNSNIPHREKEGMGHREEARVERFHQRRESARLGREDRPLLEEGLKASVGKGLG